MPRALSSLARARAGKTWPPVPPPAKTTFTAFLREDDQQEHEGDVFDEVTVGADAPLEQLIATVMSLNLQQGIENGLDAKLVAALHALDDISNNNDDAAINMLVAFIQNVEAQRGHSLTDPQADQLVTEAQAVIDLLSS